MSSALGVWTEDQLLCVACAEEVAEASGYGHLFWATCGTLVHTMSQEICPKCGRAYGAEDSAEAAERVARFISDVVE